MSITFFSPRESTAAVCYDHYYRELLQKYPDYTWVYGSNLKGTGYAGQAIIRDEPNAFGVPTKRLPAMTSASFMTGTPADYAEVDIALGTIEELLAAKKVVVFPLTGLGTGLAKLNIMAPELLAYIDGRVSAMIHADYTLLRHTR